MLKSESRQAVASFLESVLTETERFVKELSPEDYEAAAALILRAQGMVTVCTLPESESRGMWLPIWHHSFRLREIPAIFFTGRRRYMARAVNSSQGMW